MKINYFRHKKKDMDKVNNKEHYNISNPCPCGCSEKPFLLLCDGNNHFMNIIFENAEEKKAFKDAVNEW